jgi:hypothetical protein
MRTAVGRLLLRMPDDSSLDRWSRRARPTSPVLSLQTGYAGLLETALHFATVGALAPSFRSIAR